MTIFMITTRDGPNKDEPWTSSENYAAGDANSVAIVVADGIGDARIMAGFNAGDEGADAWMDSNNTWVIINERTLNGFIGAW